MREFIKRAIPTIQDAATVAAIAGAGVITFFAIKDRNEGPRRSVTFQGTKYTFGSDKFDKKSEGTEHYICPPFGGRCKSFKTEEQESTVRNRV